LRTVLAVFALVATGLGWLAWNAKIVRQRRALVASLGAHSAVEFGSATRTPAPATPSARAREKYREQEALRQLLDGVFLWPSKDPYDPFSHRLAYDTLAPSASSDLPWVRRWLGDEPMRLIAYFPGPPVGEVRRLFPEARVMVATEPWPEWKNVRGGQGRQSDSIAVGFRTERELP
jgi:hypothetical protein